MLIGRYDDKAQHCEGHAVVAEVLGPFDVHGYMPGRLKGR